MKFRMDKTLRFWVECSYEDKKYEKANRTKAELMAKILRETVLSRRILIDAWQLCRHVNRVLALGNVDLWR
jgi:hypothetical protein